MFMGKVGRLSLPVKKFSVRLFLLIVFAVVLPLSLVSVYIAAHMEAFLRERLSQNVFQNVQRSEGYISSCLEDLAYFSNIFAYDTNLREMLYEPESSTYEASKYFDEIIARSQIENPDDLRANAKIVLIDKYGRVLSNWSLNFNDYKFLLNESWVKESMDNDGHIVWSLFSPAYIVGDKGRYISLARSILSDITSGEYIGTLIISIEQSEFERILRAYAYENDQVYILLDNGDVLMSSTSSGAFSSDELRLIYEEGSGNRQGNEIISSGNSRYLLSYYTIPHPWVFNDSQMKVFHFSDYAPIEEEVQEAMSILRFAIILVFCIVLFISFTLSRRVVKPITTLTEQLRDYSIGMHFKDLDPNRQDEIGDLHRGVLRMNARLEKLFSRVKEEHEAREHYYYESLRAQLNPHYLYNTLGTIRWMAIARSADNIVEAIDSLASTLRYSMGKESIVTVRDEIEHIESYVHIHNLRYAAYADLSVNVPEDIMNMNMMRFILQPIVENSIIHGFDKSKSMIHISISGETKDGKLYIRILDDGVGIKKEAIKALESDEKGKRLTGIGLRNVNESIKLQYGREYGIRISERTDTHGTETLFILPAITGETSEESNDSR